MKKVYILNKVCTFKACSILLSAFCIMLSTSCKDEHFDVNPDVDGRQTIWENIKSNPDLSEFAYILSNTYYSKSETSRTPQTYADLLSCNQTFTVWAPKNGSFDFSYFKTLLEENSLTAQYRVEKELIRNNMVRYARPLSGTGVDTLDLLNDKTIVFDRTNKTLGNNMITTPNIGCSNGIIHITDGAAPYLPNLYELLGQIEGADSIFKFIKGYEKFEFNEYASTQGPTVNGNITWVDSVTNLTNEYFRSMGAYLNREDSLYALIVPKNDAWKDILKKTQTYYNFMPTYTQTITTVDLEGNEKSEQVTTTYTSQELDSMLNLYAKSAICDNLVFNAKYQEQKFNPYLPWDCDSIVSTSNTKFKAPFIEPLFDGNNSPLYASNGYAYPVNHFNFRPTDTWASKKTIEAEMSRNIESNTRCTLSNYTGTFERNDSLIKYTVVRSVQSSSSANPEITFKISNTLSCKYDIYVLMAYNINAEKPAKFKATLSYHDGRKATSTTATFKPLDTDTIHKGGSNIFITRPPYIDEKGYLQYVDTIPLAKDFLLPISYYKMDKAYVTLKIASNVTSKETATYSREMWIDKIIFVAKENEVTPE